MCYDEGQLMAYVDGEASPSERERIAAHVSACEECAAAVSRLEADRAASASALESLEPAATVVSLPAAASASRRSVPPRRRIGWGQIAAAAAVVLVVGSLAFGPVRKAAADLLQVFRVQKVQTITISGADMQSMTTALKKGGHVDLQSFGEAWIDGASSKPATVTLAQAQAAVDFPVKLPGNQPAEPTLYLQKGRTYRFKLNAANINAALQSYGTTTLLPDSLNGKEFEVDIPTVVLAKYPAADGARSNAWPDAQNGVYVGMAHSPQLVVPQGVDAAQLRQVLLDLPFLPDSVRTQLAAVNDWQSTLVIPNVDGTAKNTTIDGVAAVVISPKSAAREVRKSVTGAPPLVDTTTIVWQDNGVVRAVGGPIDEGTAIALAKSTMR